jgi:hypothetical protein
MADCYSRVHVRALAILLACLAAGGCAWRTGAAEHYVGPVLFRYSAPADDGPATSQVVAIGVLGEIGRQVGISLGVIDRIAVSPRDRSSPDAGDPGASAAWSTPLSPLPAPGPGRWNASLVYQRVTGAGEPALVVRNLYGVQLVTGPEARAASLGVVSTTRVQLPEDAIAVLHYDARAPLAARFSVWRAGADGVVPAAEILKEVDR